MKAFNTNNYVDFVLLSPNPGSYSFSNYTDRNGNTCSLSENKEGTRPFFISFKPKERIYRVSVSMEKFDESGKKVKVADFVRGAPFVEGSKNSNGGDPLIREINDKKAAQQGLENKRNRAKAENIVLEMTKEDVELFAPIFGIFGDKTWEERQYKLLQIAENTPDVFLGTHARTDAKILSLIKNGLKNHVLQQRGTSVYWKDELLGSDEDEAISTLQKQSDYVKAIEKAIQQS